MDKRRLRNSVLCLILVMTLSVVLLPVKAEATTYSYTYKSAGTMTAGTYVKTKSATTSWNSDYTKATTTLYCYKITIPENGYIKVTFEPSYTYSVVYILPALSKCKASMSAGENSIMFGNSGNSTKSQTFYCALNKGTYYVTSDYNVVRVKYTFYKSGNPTNFCRAKATALAQGTYKKICFNKGYEYARWYKINLTTKKTIQITLKMYDGTWNRYDERIRVYTASGDSITCSYLDGNTYRTAKQPKGTYYIKITPTSLGDDENRVCSLTWK